MFAILGSTALAARGLPDLLDSNPYGYRKHTRRSVLTVVFLAGLACRAWGIGPQEGDFSAYGGNSMWASSSSTAVPSCGEARAVTVTINSASVSASSLQAAIDSAPAGAAIVVPDCTYYEALTITKPLTLRAATPGGVILTGSTRARPVYTLVDTASGLYKAATTCAVTWAMYRDRSLMDYKNYSNLISLTFPTGSRLTVANVSGPDEGFVNADGILYVRLRDNLNPNDPSVDLRPARCGASRGIYVKSSGVVIEGLHITNFPMSGITVDRSASNVQVRNNRLSGMQTGISVWSSASDRAIIIENNEYSGKPTYEYRRSGDQDTWRGLYDSNLITRFVSSATNGLTIRGNYVYEAFDGIEVKGGSTTSAPATTTDISGNVVQNIVDNAFEFDTGLKIANMRVHHNLAVDAYAYVSLAPFQAGRIMVDHNIFYTSPERGLQHVDWIKLKLHKGTDASNPFTNITLAHNTVVLGDSTKQKSRLYQDDEDLEYWNCMMANNALLFRTTESRYTLGPPSHASSMFGFSGNLIWGTNTDPRPYPSTPRHEDPLLRSDGLVTFSPPIGSPLIDNAVTNAAYFQSPAVGTPDIGAIEAGVPLSSSWPLAVQRPGPSWMAPTSSLRPGLPASLPPVWVGP